MITIIILIYQKVVIIRNILIPIIYIFVAPIISDDELIKIGVTIGFAIFSMIVDIVFLKIMNKNVKIMAEQLEEKSVEPFTK